LHHDLDTNPDGTVGSYSQGSGNFAPIMGASYYRDVTQFSDGSYPGGFEKEDDFAVRECPALVRECPGLPKSVVLGALPASSFGRCMVT
jgi:hypothetical protein